MQSISTIGLDIAKSVFQVHGVDATGDVIVRRQLRRRYVLAFFQKLPPPPHDFGRKRGIAEVDWQPSIAEGDANDPERTERSLD